MTEIPRIFAAFVFALSVIFICSTAANAQQIPPSYGFLEVVDYKNQPVADASVRLLNRIFDESTINQQPVVRKTNQKGLLEKGLVIRHSDFLTPFSIDKPGFYTFIDCFGLLNFSNVGWKDNRESPVKIELLKIPENRAEKKTVGNEQQKRELFLAIYKVDTAAVRKLLKAKINPAITTGDLRGIPGLKNFPAIVYAADLANIEAIKELLSAGADIRAKSSPANNLLINYLLADTNVFLYSPTEEGRKQRLADYEDGVEILLDAGANLYARDERKRSLLMIASDKGYLRAVETLLQRGLSGNEENQKDLALLIAVKQRHFEIARRLLKNGANPNFLTGDYDNSSDSGCTSPLIAAADSYNLQMVELLTANGANVNLTCKNGTSAVSKALYRVRDFYYDKSLQQMSQKIVDFLFVSELDVRAVDNSGETILIKAVQNSNYPAVERLIKMGVPVNAKNKRGETALMLAASSINRFDIVKLLVNSGADVNASFEDTNNYEGKSYYFCNTPLTNAATASDITDEPNDLTDVMRLLVERGANVNFKCGNGETALTMTARVPSVKGIKKLIELGADAKGEQGSLALKYAKERLKDDWRKRAERVVAMLEAAGAK